MYIGQAPFCVQLCEPQNKFALYVTPVNLDMTWKSNWPSSIANSCINSYRESCLCLQIWCVLGMVGTYHEILCVTELLEKKCLANNLFFFGASLHKCFFYVGQCMVLIFYIDMVQFSLDITTRYSKFIMILLNQKSFSKAHNFALY